MRVLTWNIHGNNGIGAARRQPVVAAIVASQADIVLLQEVAWNKGLHEDLRTRLSNEGLPHFAYSGRVGSAEKRYGNVIASRFPLEELPITEQPPWAQSLLAAVVDSPLGEIEVVCAHIPNGSANGWAKAETFEALSSHLEHPRSVPCVLGGDFNEPRFYTPDGEVVSFGQRQRTDGTWTMVGDKNGACGRRFPRSRWQNAVARVLGASAAHGLMHVGSRTPDLVAFEPTHTVRGRPRYFDHLMVSRELNVIDAGYRHDWREQRLSDHSAAFADLERAPPGSGGDGDADASARKTQPVR